MTTTETYDGPQYKVGSLTGGDLEYIEQVTGEWFGNGSPFRQARALYCLAKKRNGEDTGSLVAAYKRTGALTLDEINAYVAAAWDLDELEDTEDGDTDPDPTAPGD